MIKFTERMPETLIPGSNAELFTGSPMLELHTNSTNFPLAFSYKRIYDQQLGTLKTAPFVVCAMLTDGFYDYADRLIRSCKLHNLQYVLYEVPTVHQSISPKGTADPSFTKANFIHFLLETHQKPVLYVDVDCLIVDYPNIFEEYIRNKYDFAIYNWLADEHTECYIPVDIEGTNGNETRVIRNRFYKFSHSIDYYSAEQLICSGAVQFYNNTNEARILLREWQNVIAQHPNTADDVCLDYTFNNFILGNLPLKAGWLTKAYIRYAWWIYVRPIINHPDIPRAGGVFQPIPEVQGRKRFYPERAQPKNVDYYFPRDCLIDTKSMVLLKVQNGQLVRWRPLDRKLWL
jgi:hypothetical protein